MEFKKDNKGNRNMKQDGTGPHKDGRGMRGPQSERNGYVGKNIPGKINTGGFMSNEDVAKAMKDDLFGNRIEKAFFDEEPEFSEADMDRILDAIMSRSKPKKKKKEYDKEYYATFGGNEIKVSYIDVFDGKVKVETSDKKESEGQLIYVLIRAIVELLQRQSPLGGVNAGGLQNDILMIIVDHMMNNLMEHVFELGEEEDEVEVDSMLEDFETWFKREVLGK